jgi:hypothetical protein
LFDIIFSPWRFACLPVEPLKLVEPVESVEPVEPVEPVERVTKGKSIVLFLTE